MTYITFIPYFFKYQYSTIAKRLMDFSFDLYSGIYVGKLKIKH